MLAKKRSRRRSKQRFSVHKPRGTLHPRVQKVGPERFGIVCVDCAKARSKWMLCNFYGQMLVPPTEVAHTSGDFALATLQLREAIERHQIQDVVVAIERTGNYHLPVKRALAAAGFETRIVHPFATKQFRQPADPGNKTDDTDLAAIFRAAVSGFGLYELPWDATSQQLQLLARHRRDLVQKRSAVCCQIREHLEATLPGYAALFDDLWESRLALPVARRFPVPAAIRAAGVEELRRAVKEEAKRCSKTVLERIVAWAQMAVEPAAEAAMHQRVWLALEDDRLAKCGQIQAAERELAALLVQTPYVLLLSLPGINVVSAAELAGEMGPIKHYASAKTITGRAGLFPSRYQSDLVDLASGPLISCANRRLRTALLRIADNLIQCNLYFGALVEVWKSQGKDPRWSHVKIASHFSRIAYQMVAGRQVLQHPGMRQRDYILDKLLAFHREHATPLTQVLSDLQTAVGQIPVAEHGQEAAPLHTLLQETLTARRRGPQPIGEIIPLVLARLGAGSLQSKSSEVQDPG